MGIGSVCFSLPHFLTGHHTVAGTDGNSTADNICRSPRLQPQTDRDGILDKPWLKEISSLTEGTYFFNYRILILNGLKLLDVMAIA